MKQVEWDAEKNKWLKKVRGVNFDNVLQALDDNKQIAVFEHPNKKQYPNQKLLLVEMNNYVYVVPFVFKNEITAFLKTLYPSRKYTKQYLKRR